MNAANHQRLLQHIRHLAGEPRSAPSDGELLRRYLEHREEAAFAALVRRHGPMVFSVCQSVLRQRHDAEDAFQAAFLILARKAGSIRQNEGLGGWLQRVAYRVALKARADHLRSKQREASAARPLAAESFGEELSWNELRAILHAELAALPERFRAPLVLCYLEGMTQEEAARQLGWTATTVKGRLQRGREKLRRRLERRGIGLASALGAALTGQTLAETVARTIPPFTAETATATAVNLARGFVRGGMMLKLVALSALLLPVGLLAGGMSMLAPKPAETAPSAVSAEKRPAVDVHGDPLPEGAVARLGTVRFNHGTGLHALFFSADGKTIVSEGNGSLCFWDALTGKEHERLSMGKVYFEFPAVILADGKTLVSLSEGIDNRDSASFWDLAARKRIRTAELPVRRSVLSSEIADSISPDGKLCVMHVHTPAHIQVSFVDKKKDSYKLGNGKNTFRAVAFAGKERLVTSDDKNHLEVWEARTGKRLQLFFHDEPIRYLLPAPDGHYVASLEQRPSPFGRRVGRPEVVHLWDLDTGKIAQSFRGRPKYWFSNICFAPDGKTLLTSSRCPDAEDVVILWDRATGRPLLEFAAGSGINADIAAISPDGRRLAAGNYAGKFEVWDLQAGHRLTAEESRHTQAAAVVLAPRGDRATLLGRRSVSVWNTASGRRLQSFDLPEGTLNSRVLSSDGRRAVTFQLNGDEFHLLIWDLLAGKCLHTLRFPGGYQQISCAFAPDSDMLASWHPGKQALIRLWDVRSGKLIRAFPDTKSGWPGRMHFTADDKTLLVAGKCVTAYDVGSGKEQSSWRLKPPTKPSGPRTSVGAGPAKAMEDDRVYWVSLVVSFDGELIAAVPWPGSVPDGSEEDAISLYEARTGKLLRRCKDPSTILNSVKQLALSADGQLLASSNGTMVHLWEVATGKRIRGFRGHRGDPHTLAFSEDGRRLASASSDSTILIWDITGPPETDHALTEAKRKQCWDDLAGDDAARAHRAVWNLVRAGGEAVAFLQAHLHLVKPIDREQMERWVADLDADAFAVRQRAEIELEKHGKRIEPALRRVLAGKPTLEQRRRIEPLLARLEAKSLTGDALRSLRAVRVLEHIDTPQARRMLRELAGGAEGSSLTLAAQAALTRIEHSLRSRMP